ncbi:MAG: FAD-binding oxidoreductase, partial [Longispora sp.]|nr:FAD-binding oxidoreductase [Longispora sp. (in: high G+C Gram-positive bacteria)]
MLMESYWMDSTESTSYLPVEADFEVDVAVVGGGIAGICTAWELARAGRVVALLEADRIVSGMTGYTTAKLTAQHTMIYAQLRDSLGADAARLYAQSQQDAIAHVGATTAELGIDCDLERRAAYTYIAPGTAEQAEQIEKLQAEAVAAAEAGLPAEFVVASGLPFPIAGAVRVTDQAQFHPRKYLLALAEDFIARSGQVYEHTRVVDLEEGEPCRLTTEAGHTVRARQVVVATHFPVFNRARLFSRLSPHRELVIAAPIDAAADPDGMYITTAENTRSVRTAPYGDGQRLLIVTGETFKPGASGVTERFDALTEWTRQRFGVQDFAYRWAAQDNSTTDGVPYVGYFPGGDDSIFVAAGFDSWGMTNGVMSGRLLAALITGQQPAWTDLYDPRRVHPVAEATTFIKAQANVAKHFAGDRVKPAKVE